MSLDLPDGRSGAYKPSSPFELRHASTHRPLLVVVPERRLLAINGAGPRGAADFRLATTLLRTVGEIVRRHVLRDSTSRARAIGARGDLAGPAWPDG